MSITDVLRLSSESLISEYATRIMFSLAEDNPKNSRRLKLIPKGDGNAQELVLGMLLVLEHGVDSENPEITYTLEEIFEELDEQTQLIEYYRVSAKCIVEGITFLFHERPEEFELVKSGERVMDVQLSQEQLDELFVAHVAATREYCLLDQDDFDELKEVVSQGLDAFRKFVYDNDEDEENFSPFITAGLKDGLGLQFGICVEYLYFLACKVVEGNVLV